MLVYRGLQCILLGAVLCLFCACGGGGGSAALAIPPVPDKVIAHTYAGSTYEIDHVSTPETDTSDLLLSYTLNLGLSTKDIYLVFTNPTLTDAVTTPVVSWQIVGSSYVQQPDRELAMLPAYQADIPPVIGIRGTPGISRFNADPESYLTSHPEVMGGGLSSLLSVAPPAPLLDSVGVGGVDFFTGTDLSQMVSTAATCRQIVTDSTNGRKLNIWVADDSWAPCSKYNCVTQAMVDVLAAKFLVEGGNNDIYDWVTNIYGAEWGADAQSTVASQIGANNEITILLYDIAADNSTNGGVTGFFWSKDNYRKAVITQSNERVMFYIDSVLFATPELGSWESTDHWPEEIFGTLAHEFQHMISYYQKDVLLSTTGEVWLNEMASEVTEDFVANKLDIVGPRGVDPAVGSAGVASNTLGRLPQYCGFDYIPLQQWMSGSAGDDNALNSYSVNYSFGAYLARNYGGANFFHNMVLNNKTDFQAIDYALSQGGYSGENFTSVMKKWGAAVLLSADSSINVPEKYRYNIGTFMDSTIGSITYSLGSINMFNYHFAGLLGPKIYSSLPASDAMAGKYKTSNMFYKWGTGLSGVVSKVITIPQGSKLTVVIK